VITLETATPVLADGVLGMGEPADIPEGRRVAIRLAEDRAA